MRFFPIRPVGLDFVKNFLRYVVSECPWLKYDWYSKHASIRVYNMPGKPFSHSWSVLISIHISRVYGVYGLDAIPTDEPHVAGWWGNDSPGDDAHIAYIEL